MTTVLNRMATLGRTLVPPAVTGLAYYWSAVIALTLTQGHDGIAAIWPSSGILLSVLLIAPRSAARWHVAAAAIASLAANLGLDNALPVSTGFTIANVTESMLAAWLVTRRGGDRILWTDPAPLGWFCIAAMVATATSATMAAVFAQNASPVFWFSWFSTDLLGILILTPLIMIVRQSLGQIKTRRHRGAIRKVVAVFALQAGLCAVTFGQSTFPLLFLPMIGILIAVFQLGPLGAVGSVVIATVSSSLAVGQDSGPLMLIDATDGTRSLFLQFYLLALFAAALPVAALLASGGRLQRRLRENVRLLQLAESAANVGHWRLDIVSNTISWSPEVFKIHGLEGDTPPPIDGAIDAYHPDDRQLVAHRLEIAIQNREGFEFNARIIRPDGEVRHVFSRGEFDQIDDHAASGLFGIVQDITDRVAYEEGLRAASARAQQAADDAKVMAETDQLTGVANRRRIYSALNRSIQDADISGQAMAVAIFDIDHFKAVNDRFGHQVGDEVIRRVADDAGRHLRDRDLLGRLGGEEFVIVLPSASAHVAMIVAERVRRAVAAGEGQPRVTISVGIAERSRGETVEALLQRADRALYVAKNQGRNTTSLAA